MNRRATYADLEAASPDKIAEIVNGKLYLSPYFGPRAASVHTQILAFSVGFDFGRGREWLILPRPQLHFPVPDFGDENILVPEVAAWRRERVASLRDLTETRDDPRVRVAPDWACEVCAQGGGPSFEDKLDLYGRAGVTHVWAAMPEGLETNATPALRRHIGGLPTLRIYTARSGGGWDRSEFILHGPDELWWTIETASSREHGKESHTRICVPPFEAVELDLADVFDFEPHKGEGPT